MRNLASGKRKIFGSGEVGDLKSWVSGDESAVVFFLPEKDGGTEIPRGVLEQITEDFQLRCYCHYGGAVSSDQLATPWMKWDHLSKNTRQVIPEKVGAPPWPISNSPEMLSHSSDEKRLFELVLDEPDKPDKPKQYLASGGAQELIASIVHLREERDNHERTVALLEQTLEYRVACLALWKLVSVDKPNIEEVRDLLYSMDYLGRVDDLYEARKEFNDQNVEEQIFDLVGAMKVVVDDVLERTSPNWESLKITLPRLFEVWSDVSRGADTSEPSTN